MKDETPNDKGSPKDHGQVVLHSRRRISWAWLFPILAAAATIWLFWSDWKSNGPEVEVEFDTAPGIQAGKTPLIYRGVVAGIVKGVKLDADMDRVIVSVRLKAFASELAREGTVFWIDQPVVGLGDTSGLDALIQGNSLQARIGDGPPATSFVGVPRMPLTPLNSPALVIKLRSPNIPLLDRGSPVFYRGVAVGVVEDKILDANGVPYLHVTVEKKFAETVRANARFWSVPAASLKVGQGGVKLDLLGLKAILLGGVEFDVFGQPGEMAQNGSEFHLYGDEVAARATGREVRISFKDGQGIIKGATEVRRLGLPVGVVESVTLNEATQTVDAVVRFQPAYEDMHKEGTVFTLVGPRISLNGVSGLDTLVSGPYIDCEPGSGPQVADSFVGRTSQNDGALSAEDMRAGVHVTLRAGKLSNIHEATPVLYRGLIVGQVVSKAISEAGEPTLGVVVRRDYANTLVKNSRFWIVPATSVEVGAGMLRLDIAGIKTLLQGSLAFDNFDPREDAATGGAQYELFADEAAARATSAPISISFENGQGLQAGLTQVRYLGIPVGLVVGVKAVKGKIETTVRLNPGYDFLRTEGSDFAIVRLQAGLTGVTGLETVVSGVYIEAVPSGGKKLANSFVGVTTVKADFKEEEQSSFEVTVTSTRTALGVGTPVTYRGISVGKVGRKTLSPDGRSVSLHLIVERKYANLIRANTKFWDASGMKVSLGFFSLKIQGGPLDSIAGNGIAFATPNSLGVPAKFGDVFELAPGPRPEWFRWAPDISLED